VITGGKSDGNVSSCALDCVQNREGERFLVAYACKEGMSRDPAFEAQRRL
jgi:hypothetical protein